MLVYIAVSEHCFSQFKLFPLAKQYLTNKNAFIKFSVKLTKINHTNKYFFDKFIYKNLWEDYKIFFESKYATFKILLSHFCY